MFQNGECMKVIMCLDNNNGMMFNNRRTSRDREVIKDIVYNYKNEKISISVYSKELFEDYLKDNGLESLEDNNIIVDDDYISKINDNDYCFIEEMSIIDYNIKLEQIVVYRWDRIYPADTYCQIDFDDYVLKGKEEIKGYSHEKISKEIYILK